MVTLFADQSGFLTDFWRDLIGVVGVIGVVATIVALLIAVWQLKKTTDANQAATSAALQSLNASKDRYDRYVVAQLSRFNSEARVYVDKEEWFLAALRLDDVADLIAHLDSADSEWMLLADDVRSFADKFQRIGAAQIKFIRLQSKWRNFQSLLSRKISQRHTPFQPIRESGDADG